MCDSVRMQKKKRGPAVDGNRSPEGAIMQATSKVEVGLTNCFRCNKRLVMNFRVRTTHAFDSDMMAEQTNDSHAAESLRLRRDFALGKGVNR